MAGSNLAEALSLVDRAEQELQKVRLETPGDYMGTIETRQAVTGQMRTIDGEYLEKALTLMDGSSPEDRVTFIQKFGPVHRTFSYVAGEAVEGRLPQSKNAPWPPHEWTIEENMRADAADAEAEPATNGYGGA